jgi:hypothetical protein
MQRKRVRVELLGTCLARSQALGRLFEINHCLALDLAFVTAEVPASQVERFVNEDEHAERLLPRRDGVCGDVARTLTDPRREHRDLVPHIRVRPAERRGEVCLPLARGGAADFADAERVNPRDLVQVSCRLVGGGRRREGKRSEDRRYEQPQAA